VLWIGREIAVGELHAHDLQRYAVLVVAGEQQDVGRPGWRRTPPDASDPALRDQWDWPGTGSSS
jgi:hypothetical protein